MQISDISAQLTLDLGRRSQFLSSLRVGQILQATAVAPNEGGHVKLQVGSTVVVAQTPLKPELGQRLALLVEKAGELPELRLIAPEETETLQVSALKSALPRQLALDKLLEALSSAIRPAVTAQSAELHQAVHTLQSRLPTAKDLQSARLLRRALKESGLFLESNLANSAILKSDFKANLVRLLHQLRIFGDALSAAKPLSNQSGSHRSQTSGNAHPADPLAQSEFNKLLHLTEGALARVKLHQLVSLPDLETGQQIWQLELPFQEEGKTQVLHFRIEQGMAREGKKSTPDWSVTLRFDFAAIGPIQAKLILNDETIATHLWAEHTRTRNRIEHQLPLLEQSLVRAGLKVERLVLHRTPIPDPLPLRIPQTGLLDEKA